MCRRALWHWSVSVCSWTSLFSSFGLNRFYILKRARRLQILFSSSAVIECLLFTKHVYDRKEWKIEIDMTDGLAENLGSRERLLKKIVLCSFFFVKFCCKFPEHFKMSHNSKEVNILTIFSSFYAYSSACLDCPAQWSAVSISNFVEQLSQELSRGQEKNNRLRNELNVTAFFLLHSTFSQ